MTATSEDKSSDSLSRQSPAGMRRRTAHTRGRPPRVEGSCRRAKPARLGAYLDACGRRRELVCLNGRAGTALVVDRDAETLSDRLLLAHLGVDEPAANAELVCRDYLLRQGLARPRRLRASDLLTCPGETWTSTRERHEAAAVEVLGQVHRLCRIRSAEGRPELRWACCPAFGSDAPEPVGLRELIGKLESYEPMRAITAAAIDSHRHDRTVSLRHLQAEYRWLCKSPVVLNRALREAVLRATAGGGLTMSEIALRCGVAKRDRRGKRSGESSWLARRVGLMPEGGAEAITPWVHSDVLALIARDGLRVSPREVEVP